MKILAVLSSNPSHECDLSSFSLAWEGRKAKGEKEADTNSLLEWVLFNFVSRRPHRVLQWCLGKELLIQLYSPTVHNKGLLTTPHP